MISFISNRVNLLEFNDRKQIIQKYNNKELIYPIGCEFSALNNEIIIATTKDVRYIDIQTGKTKKIFTGLTN